MHPAYALMETQLIELKQQAMKWTWIVLSFLAGACLPLQGGFNARLGKSIQSPINAAMISFQIGAIVLFVYSAITRQPFSFPSLKATSPFVFIGGAFGAFYVTTVMLAFTRVGSATTFGLVVAGQMAMALALDHFGILVTEQHKFSATRLLALVLLLAGVVLIRKE
jgi:transporter family-2 protein